MLIVMLIILQNWGWPGLHQTPNQKQTKRNSKPDLLALPASLQRESCSFPCSSVMFCFPFQAPSCDALLLSSFLAASFLNSLSPLYESQKAKQI